jgi:FKBP-type peptidyl-prolyl cis-trans isomerase SlpA
MTEHGKLARVPLRDLDAAEPVTAVPGSGGIGPGQRVTLNFALYLANGGLIDGNFGKAPVSFLFGDGSLLPGFERALQGLGAGAQVDVVIPAADAFGAVNEDNQQRYPRFQFPPDLALSENLLVEFTDAAGYQQAGRVVSIGARYVEIDFNHPLAGRDIRFVAEVHEVAPHAD